MKRKELVLKAGNLAESWELARESKNYLEETSGGWMKRTKEETARIREEEKLERLEMIMKKSKKGYLAKEETKELKEKTTIILELAEN